MRDSCYQKKVVLLMAIVVDDETLLFIENEGRK